MRKLGFALLLLVALGVTLSCYSKTSYQNPSRTVFRAFISNALHPVTGGHLPAIEIMNATLDQLTLSPIDLSAVPDVGPMVLSGDKSVTLAYSPGSNAFILVNNATEQVLGTSATLPDSADSFLLTPDDLEIYAAVPNAPITGHPAGAVIQISGKTAQISATIPIPHARFVAQAMSGSRIVAFSDNSGGICNPESGAVTIIDAAKIGTSVDPRTTLCGFDHPVGAAVRIPAASQVFVLECGPECGGTAAALTPIDLTTNTVGAKIPVPAATTGFVAGSTVYIAGTPPGMACDSSTQATSCGVLTIVDANGLKVTNSSPLLITDGYHNHMEVTDDGLLWIGATTCSNVSAAASGSTPGEVRGCLSTFDTTSPATKPKFPPQNGDVTGIAPIPGRKVVYTIAGGTFQVWDTTTGQLLPNHQTDVVGLLVDVKAVDNAP